MVWSASAQWSKITTWRNLEESLSALMIRSPWLSADMGIGVVQPSFFRAMVLGPGLGRPSAMEA
ncbi:hypothetical protein BFF78_22150 [Streptomyces fodineus]|uniref:Uncharacterized protein n=1 Tax=Streptomyces fodineus TaxID=1904616 RepID=A0A1D7YDJ1_9ACTN|nr:hypothetical protein BFF78_22150 [Streptomyces fodineus]